MILNTFHFAGVAEMNISLGLPRLIEIFDARKNPSTPRMELYLKPKYAKTAEMVKKVAEKIIDAFGKNKIEAISSLTKEISCLCIC